jgi:protein-S-isoprenylcysteine O-methyltransferase Ste14
LGWAVAAGGWLLFMVGFLPTDENWWLAGAGLVVTCAGFGLNLWASKKMEERRKSLSGGFPMTT